MSECEHVDGRRLPVQVGKCGLTRKGSTKTTLSSVAGHRPSAGQCQRWRAVNARVQIRNSTFRVSLPATPDGPILRGNGDVGANGAAEPLRVLLVGAHASPVGPVDAVGGRRVEVVGCAATAAEAASLAELYRPDVVLLAAAGREHGLSPDLMGAVLRIADLCP